MLPTGEGAGAAIVDYADLMRLDQTLTDNRTPKHTTVITGSRNIDTRVVGSCRVLFVIRIVNAPLHRAAEA